MLYLCTVLDLCCVDSFPEMLDPMVHRLVISYVEDISICP